VQHQITISGNNKLELRADIFNIFNAENLSTVIMPHKVKFKVALAPVDCLHKEMHRHRDSFSLEFVIYSNNQYPASWYGFAGCFNLR
jgi:hypothetical protein